MDFGKNFLHTHNADIVVSVGRFRKEFHGYDIKLAEVRQHFKSKLRRKYNGA